MKRFLVILCTAIAAVGFGQTNPNPQFAIGLFGDKAIKTLTIQAATGRYFVLNDKNDTLKLIGDGDDLVFNVADWKLHLKSDTGKNESKYYTLQGVDSTASFRVISPSLKQSLVYDGGLRLAANGGKIKLVNYILLEQYVDDVLRAEVGKDHTVELYKVQAVISRTYALANINKHKAEFFNLCDKVHCQVYNGKGYPNKDIDSATVITRGQIVTYNNKPIDAAFSANCGGQTVNSEDIWNHAVPYLRAVTDTFCTRSPGAYWEKCIKADEWTKYFMGVAGVKPNDRDTLLFQFDQQNRMLYYVTKTQKVPLKQMRTDLKLRSTFFSVYKSGNDIILCGRGYGHGVGLCQEGAIAMARKGYDFKQIINFYFKGVNIVPLSSITLNK
jgi:stage II sporulation protein D